MGKASKAKRDGITEEQAKAALQQVATERRQAFERELDALLKKHGKRIGAIAIPQPRENIGPLVVGAQVIYVDAPEPPKLPQQPT